MYRRALGSLTLQENSNCHKKSPLEYCIIFYEVNQAMKNIGHRPTISDVKKCVEPYFYVGYAIKLNSWKFLRAGKIQFVDFCGTHNVKLAILVNLEF